MVKLIQLGKRRNEKNLEGTIKDFKNNLVEFVHGDVAPTKKLEVLKKRLERSDGNLSKKTVTETYSKYQEDALRMLGETLRTFYSTTNSESSAMLDFSSWFTKFLKVSDFEYIDKVLENTPSGNRGRELADQIEDKRLKADELISLLTKYDLGESDGKNIFIEDRIWITLRNLPIDWETFRSIGRDLIEKGVDPREGSYCEGNGRSSYSFTVPGKQLIQTYEFLSETTVGPNNKRKLINYLEGDKKPENSGQKVYEILDNGVISIASEHPRELANPEKVNQLVKKIFGKRFDGRFTPRAVVLDSDYPLTLACSEGLELIAKGNGDVGGGYPIGEFKEKDGSHLIIKKDLFGRRKKKAEEFAREYQEMFGKRPTIEYV